MRISDWSSDVCSSDLPSACEANPPWISWRSSAVVVGVMGESLETITLLGVKPTRGDWAARSNFPASFGSALGSACICASARRSRNRSEEHTSELQSLMRISYAVFCLKKKKQHHRPKKNTITSQ